MLVRSSVATTTATPTGDARVAEVASTTLPSAAACNGGCRGAVCVVRMSATEAAGVAAAVGAAGVAAAVGAAGVVAGEATGTAVTKASTQDVAGAVAAAASTAATAVGTVLRHGAPEAGCDRMAADREWDARSGGGTPGGTGRRATQRQRHGRHRRDQWRSSRLDNIL